MSDKQIKQAKYTETFYKGNEESDYKEGMVISLDTGDKNKITLVFFDGYLEDATISKNFKDIHNIGDLVMAAYNLGRNDHKIDFKFHEESIEEIE